MGNNTIILTVIFVTLIVVLMFAGVAVAFYIASRQKLERDMKIKQAALDYEKELRFAEAAVSESVMSHIGRELHDNVSNRLTQLRLQIESKMLDNTENENLLQPMQATLVIASDQLRSISRALSTDFLQNNDLVHSISMELDRIKQLGLISVHFDQDDQQPKLTNEQHLLAFRIFQEAAGNTLKHSKANNLTVKVKNDPDFSLVIIDDGQGFQPGTGTENGVRNMKKRAELAAMRFELLSSPGKGCTVILKATENTNP